MAKKFFLCKAKKSKVLHIGLTTNNFALCGRPKSIFTEVANPDKKLKATCKRCVHFVVHYEKNRDFIKAFEEYYGISLF